LPSDEPYTGGRCGCDARREKTFIKAINVLGASQPRTDSARSAKTCPTAVKAVANGTAHAPPLTLSQWSVGFCTTARSGPANSGSNETNPSISPDGLELYFSSDRLLDRTASWNLWVATRDSTNEPFNEPVPLNINTNAV
jgi:hypothetical protein